MKLRRGWHARLVRPGIAILAFAAVLGIDTGPVAARAVSSVPPLPPPSGRVVTVSTEAQLQSAVASMTSDTTIIISAGTYNLTSTLYVNGTFSNIAIRGASNSAADVVLVGRGMTNSSYGAVPHGIWVGGNVNGITIANLTVRDVYYHPIILNAGTQAPRVYNVRLLNAGEQFLKANPNGSGGGVDNGIVEYSIFEYATAARGSYTNGVDVHTGRNWIVRDNLFLNIRAPQGQLAGPAVLMWNSSSGSIIERNTFINCQREIALGLIDRSSADHSGGVARNNFIYRSGSVAGDTAIGIFDSPNTVVAHNSIFLSGTYPSPIEYRFAGSSGVVIVNNLLDGSVTARDGATGSSSGNVTSATGALFVDPAAGDLHLRSTAGVAIDRGVAHATPDDWDGEPRPGTGRDVGADEFGGAAGPPAAPTNLRIVS